MLSTISILAAAFTSRPEDCAPVVRRTDRPPLAEGCTHVYLDVGTNIGVQLRKLFEPRYYPFAPVLEQFDQYFGSNRMTRRGPTLCAFGFEANPLHSAWLSTLESAYRRAGHRVTIF